MATIIGIFHTRAEAEALTEQLTLNELEPLILDGTSSELQAGGPDSDLGTQLRGFGIRDELVPQYEDRIKRGMTLLMIRTTALNLPTAQRILREAEPKDIDLLPEG